MANLSRRCFAGNLLVAGAALVLPASSVHAQQRPDRTKLAIAVDGKATFSCLPLTIADQLGFFRIEGLDVQINDFSDAAAALQAMQSGAADVCSGTFDRTLHMQAKNQMVKAFVVQSRAPQLAFGVSTRNLPAYADITDLRGKKLGVTALDSTASVMARLLLARGGLNAQDVAWVPVGSSTNALNALRTGQIDALGNTDPVMTMLEQKGEVKIISDARTMKGTTDLFGGAMPGACLYAPVDFLQKNAAACQALANAVVHALKWLQTAGPGDIIKAVPESYLLGDRAVYLASFNKIRESISLDGLMPEDGPTTSLRALSQFDAAVRQAKIDVTKTYTNEFVRRAKLRFRV